ncbi:inositol polyphosphate 5-phosphatase OCRL-like isoform X2 [Watersipora subatra]|uniref:inositol polyphosphate 5-phosphatase OCRL-like isoform X2 n=1 Tax=Watersipora subatra TaxID=2589382 RepID=UPI00355C41A5
MATDGSTFFDTGGSPGMDGTEVMDNRNSANSFSNRDAHVRLLMSKREAEFLTIEKLRLFIGTWNVNGKAATEDLAPWLVNAVENPPALLVLGFQELDLSKEALLFSMDSVREAEWKAACDKAVRDISPHVNYSMVQLVRMVGVMLIVYASDSVVEHIQGVASGTVATGIMGFMGNKGGVAIRLEVHNTSLCFITSHLAAHMEQTERRNQDFKDIRERMTFSGPQIDVNSNNLTISSHDLAFWLGDLNYRINDLPIDKVKLLISDSNWEPLLKYDQLIKEKKAKNAFSDYRESAIAFPPTYKYDAGTNDYDTSEKMRAPAWTDRILYRGHHIEPHIYACHMKHMISDHKPVSHTFTAGVKVIDNDKYHSVYEDVMKQLDKLENEYLPQVKLSILELNFGEVRFMEPKMLKLEIENTGQVPADFSFIPKLNEGSYCKKWMVIRPYMECVLPGEKAVLNITVHVDERTTGELNAGTDSIEDILVLHLEGGKDFFVTINGQYTLSCFGSSLSTLIRLPQPIREVSRQELFDMEASVDAQNAGPRSMPVPKELFFLLDNINAKGKNEMHLFQQRGLHQEIVDIRESLDTSLSGELLFISCKSELSLTPVTHSWFHSLYSRGPTHFLRLIKGACHTLLTV